MKVDLAFRFNLRSVLLDFQSFTEKPVFSVLLLVLSFGLKQYGSCLCAVQISNEYGV